MAFRFIAAALAAAGAVSAQCSASGTSTIQSSADASALSTCTTFSGSIAIATGTTDNINIPNVKVITGDLVMQNTPNITQLGADSLQTVGGNFDMDDCQVLSSLTFPDLTQVGEFLLNALPNLQQLGFTSNLKLASQLNIQNTFLSSLSGINLQQVDSIYIANNRLLQDISFQVSNISSSLTIESNGDRLQVNFPNLATATNLTFRDCPTVSIPSLANVTGSLGFYENSFDNLTTPNLTLVGGTLAFVGNNALTNISMPLLKTITGGFQVQNNTDLTDVSGSFPDVQEIGGAFDFYGNFTSVKLPALKDCRGAFNLQATGNITSDCSTFQAESGSNNVIKGKFTCAGSQSNPGGSGTTPTSSGSSSTKKSDARHLDISSNAAIGIGSVLAAILGLF